MATLLSYLESKHQFGDPVLVDLYFKNVGFYKYKYIAKDIAYEDVQTRRLFERFIKHPLVYWELNLIYENGSLSLDYITNLSNHPTNNLNYSVYSGKYFVHDPYMLYNRGDFLKNFIFEKNINEFNSEKNILTLSDYQKNLCTYIREDNLKNGFFLQKNTSKKILVTIVSKFFY